MDVGRRCLSGGVRQRVTAAPSAVSRASSASREVYSRHFSPRTHATHPTGISHSPEEYVEDPDADAGGDALATVLANLLTQP